MRAVDRDYVEVVEMIGTRHPCVWHTLAPRCCWSLFLAFSAGRTDLSSATPKPALQSESRERSHQISGALLLRRACFLWMFRNARKPLMHEMHVLTALSLLWVADRYWYHPKEKFVYGSGSRELEPEPEPEPS